MAFQMTTRYWALLSLIAWGGLILTLHLVRLDTFGLDEGAALALLLDWSVSDNIMNTIAIHGAPDLRALLLFPLGVYWPGSMLAAKVFTLIIIFTGAFFLYTWNRKTESSESALIAIGLLLIAPVTILQADTISVGGFILLIFGAGAYLDTRYRNSPHTISNLYFLQMLLVAISVTLHPMGLAYPLALAWQWHKNPKSAKQKTQVWIGVACAIFIILAMQVGWIALNWLENPLHSMNNAFFANTPGGMSAEPSWITGSIALIFLCILIYKDRQFLLNDFMGNLLVTACIIGLLAADSSWAFVCIALILFRGIPWLIDINKKIKANSFAGQRGLVMVCIVVLTMLFMQQNKLHAHNIAIGLLSPSDELIQDLAQYAADKDQAFLAASEWPARTMIVCRRDVLRLPPATASGEELLTSIRGLTHVMFDQHNPNNAPLAKNFSEITHATKTLKMKPSGVIIKIHNQKTVDKEQDTAQHDKPSSKP